MVERHAWSRIPTPRYLDTPSIVIRDVADSLRRVETIPVVVSNGLAILGIPASIEIAYKDNSGQSRIVPED
jgi:hypothetical protein